MSAGSHVRPLKGKAAIWSMGFDHQINSDYFAYLFALAQRQQRGGTPLWRDNSSGKEPPNDE